VRAENTKTCKKQFGSTQKFEQAVNNQRNHLEQTKAASNADANLKTEMKAQDQRKQIENKN
jgi:hypothetical protein